MPPTVLPKKGKCGVETPSRGKGELEMVGQEFEECLLYHISSPCGLKCMFHRPVLEARFSHATTAYWLPPIEMMA